MPLAEVLAHFGIPMRSAPSSPGDMMEKSSNQPLLIRSIWIALLLLGLAPSPGRTETLSALAFDGMDDVAEINPPLLLGSTFTEEAWILPNLKDDKYHGIVGANATKVENRAPGIWLKNWTCLHAGFGDGTKWIAFSSPPGVITLNEWNHVAATYDGTTYRLYANGTEVAAQVSKHLPAPQPVRRMGRVDYWFPGAIREVRLWKRALTGDEIRAQISKQLTGTERGLVACFRLNDGSGEQAKNSVPNGPKATLLNGPTWINSSAPVSRALLKTTLLQHQSAGVQSFSPTGDNNAPDAPIEITLQQKAGKVDSNSIQLTQDHKIVEAIITTNDAGALVIRCEQNKPLEAGSTHTVKLFYTVQGSSIQTNDLSYDFSVSANILLSQ